MSTPTPYDLFVRYLVTKNVSDLDTVNAELKSRNLLAIDQDSFDTQFNLVMDQIPEGILSQIENRSYSVDFMGWMRILEVGEFWSAELPIKDSEKASTLKLAQDIHQDQTLRITINALLMKGVAVPDLVQSLAVKFATLLKDRHIALYRDYFFNPCRMPRGAWRSYLKKLPATEQHIYFLALSEPLDIVKTELDLTANHNTATTLQYLLSKSYMKAKQYLNIGTISANEEARAWIDQVLKLSEKYEKHRSADSTDFGKALQMEFDFVDTEFPTPDSETLAELNAQIKQRKDSPHQKKGEDEPEDLVLQP